MSIRSWSTMHKRLNETLCDQLKGRITYFYTCFREAHDAPQCAAIRLDGKELVRFKWIHMYDQEANISALLKQGIRLPWDEMDEMMKPQWDEDCTYSGGDFFGSALKFFNLSIADALQSENYIVKILAILDKRVGKRTLEKIREAGEYRSYPDWAKQFYELRLSL